MAEVQNKRKKLKCTVDAISYFFVCVPALCSVWAYFAADSDGHLKSSFAGKMPIQVGVLLADMLPFLFGVIWLCIRYSDAAAKIHGGKSLLAFMLAGPLVIAVIAGKMVLR